MKIAAANALANWRARMCPTMWPPPMQAPAASGRIHHPGAVRSPADLGDSGAVAKAAMKRAWPEADRR
jgi:hypothetical protein